MDLDGKLKRKLSKGDVGHDESIQGQDCRDCYVCHIQTDLLTTNRVTTRNKTAPTTPRRINRLRLFHGLFGCCSVAFVSPIVVVAVS